MTPQVRVLIGICLAIVAIPVLQRLQPPSDRPDPIVGLLALGPDETNPPLVHVGETWPLPKGTEVWGRKNEKYAGEVVECEQNGVFIHFAFGVGPQDALTKRVDEGTATWVSRRSAKVFWIRADK